MSESDESSSQSSQEKSKWIPKAIADVPCLKESLMYGIGGMALTGATYNFTTSKNPFASKYFLGLYPLIFFGTWFACRFQYRTEEYNIKQLHSMISSEKLAEYARLPEKEKRKLDEEWAKSLKPTRPKDYRDD